MTTLFRHILTYPSPVATVILLAGLTAGIGSELHAQANTATMEVEFDSVLAAELEADQYGMAQYVMAFLKAGPNRDLEPAEAAELQKAHLANIRRMAEEGDLVLAGPFMDSGSVRGIYVFDVRTVEEARVLTETDPAIQAGSLEMELRPWYGSAALRALNEIHAQIASENP